MKKGQEAWDKLVSDYEKMSEKCDALTRSGEEMGERIDGLRRSVASYKGSNTVLRRKVESLTKELENLRKLNSEADELYDKKAMECEQLKKELSETRALACKTQAAPVTTRVAELEQTVESKNALIESLKEKVQGLVIEKSELEGKVASLTEEQTELYETIEYLQKPWWKRIF